ncbi:hypothetical protein PGT21_014871 [Puccinia graminis f. sp. tritici]|uniref:Uncharacterized protein n=1 Tax=Puccinia graminis f. sp. tritici TaxID=56615 RepID=A0A5B0Q2X7_PUCGR|nr:hypothetical protein PGT21_014871 [Puccinia graminis f. sp. tritici]
MSREAMFGNKSITDKIRHGTGVDEDRRYGGLMRGGLEGNRNQHPPRFRTIQLNLDRGNPCFLNFLQHFLKGECRLIKFQGLRFHL